ncbi:MAG: helix-turn-helix domain-containing protein [Chloroflexota bacterium]|nr:helix-turn-helix domain-containing protein [Chloroflexota bacterium]
MLIMAVVGSTDRYLLPSIWAIGYAFPMLKSHRIALRPTLQQESLFLQHAGYARFAYNWAASEFQAGLQVGEWLGERSLRPRLNRVKELVAPWGAALSQNAAKYAIIDFGQSAEAWGQYRRKVKTGQRVGFPRYKRRKHEQGFRADNGPETVRVEGKTVVLPKIGPVAMVEYLRFAGSIREVTVNRTSDVWLACFCVEDGKAPSPVKEGPTIGMDVGVGVTATCSDGRACNCSQKSTLIGCNML